MSIFRNNTVLALGLITDLHLLIIWLNLVLHLSRCWVLLWPLRTSHDWTWSTIWLCWPWPKYLLLELLHAKVFFLGTNLIIIDAHRLLYAYPWPNFNIFKRLKLLLSRSDLFHIFGQFVESYAQILNLISIYHILWNLVSFIIAQVLRRLLLDALVVRLLLGAGSSLLFLWTCCLVRMIWIALSLYLRKQISFVFQKERMLEHLVITALFLELVKIIHIQLSNEGRKVVMFEILWQNLIAEQIWLFYLKAVASWSPADDVVKLLAVHDLVYLNQKRWNMIDRIFALISIHVELRVSHIGVARILSRILFVNIENIVLKCVHSFRVWNNGLWVFNTFSNLFL